MYERMLDGQTQPSYEEFTEYCGERKALLEKADDFLINQLHAEKEMRFPYGKHYGWGLKYSLKRSISATFLRRMALLRLC